MNCLSLRSEMLLIAIMVVGVNLSLSPIYGKTCVDAVTKISSMKKTSMEKFVSVFGTKTPIIGMIHLAGDSDQKVIKRALQELALFEKMGVHAAIIENYHGTLAQVEFVLRAAQNRFQKLVLGVNVLPNDYAIAFYLSRLYGAKFIQLDFISGRYGNAADPVELNAHDYDKYRSIFSDILVLGGVHPKYYTPIEGSDLLQDLRAAQLRADAVVVTGAGTGQKTPFSKIKNFREILGIDYPLVIGAGVTAENGREQLKIGNGAIVGSYFKEGDTTVPIIEERISDILKQLPTYNEE